MNKLTSTKETGKKGFLSKITGNNKRYLAKLYGVLATVMCAVYALGCNAMVAFAAEGEGGGSVANSSASFDTVVGFIVTWVQRIGLVVAFIGAVQFGFAWKNDDAEAKQRGLMTLASGFIVVAICIAYDQLFKSAV